MSTRPPPSPATAPRCSPARRIAATVMLIGLIVLVLWVTLFSLVTSLIIGSGIGVIVIGASATSDLVETILDAIANIVLAALAAVAAIMAAVLALFGN